MAGNSDARRLVISVILSLTASSPSPRRRDRSFSRLTLGGGETPPQRMMRSASGIPRSLLQFLPKLGERDVDEVRGFSRSDPAFVVRLGVPAARELFDNL